MSVEIKDLGPALDILESVFKIAPPIAKLIGDALKENDEPLAALVRVRLPVVSESEITSAEIRRAKLERGE